MEKSGNNLNSSTCFKISPILPVSAPISILVSVRTSLLENVLDHHGMKVHHLAMLHSHLNTFAHITSMTNPKGTCREENKPPCLKSYVANKVV